MRKIHIPSLESGTKPEDTKLFRVLLRKFNREHVKKLTKEELLSSLKALEKFELFVMDQALIGKLSIDEKILPEWRDMCRSFKKRNFSHVKSIDEIYDSIFAKIYQPQGYKKNDEIVRVSLNKFKSAYGLMKQVFEGKNRESNNERYFQHLKDVTLILLNELGVKNIDVLIKGLLHDVMEDIPGFSREILEYIYGPEIAQGVWFVTKKPFQNYLTEGEKQQFNEYGKNPTEFSEQLKKLERIGKDRRNLDYFGHMSELEDENLIVKFADRIHNLRTLEGCGSEKVEKKIAETEKYFVDLAEKRSPISYRIIMEELTKLKECKK